MAVADHHRHRERLAERTAEAQHHATDQPRTGRREHGIAHDFPAGGAEGEGRLTLRLRYGQQYLAADARDVWEDHDGEQEAGRYHAWAVGRPPEQRDERPEGHECRHDRAAEQRHEDEHSPEPVHHRRNRGEQVDQKRDRLVQAPRSDVDGEDGDAEGERGGDAEGEQRGEQRAGNSGQGAESGPGNVPCGAEGQIGGVRRQGRPRGAQDHGGEQHEHEGNRGGAHRRDRAIEPVAERGLHAVKLGFQASRPLRPV